MTDRDILWTAAMFTLFAICVLISFVYLMVRMDALTECALQGQAATPSGWLGWTCVTP